MTKLANIVYWYPERELPKDGGGLRVLAWKRALQNLGYHVTIIGLKSLHQESNHQSTNSALRTKIHEIKRAYFPLPFARGVSQLPQAELTVATVPAIFAAVLKQAGAGRVVFDWMDLGSEYARTVGSARFSSAVGGALQALQWRGRETRLSRKTDVNFFAGYSDLTRMRRRNRTANGFWLPTPHELVRSSLTPATELRRVGFIGNMNFPPNLLAIKWFFRTYRREIASSPIEFVIAGFGSSELAPLNLPATLLGTIADPGDFYLDLDAVIVPAVAGGGIKVKAVEAMSFGIPVFGTRHAAAGFSPQFSENIRDLSRIFTDGTDAMPAVDPDDFESCFSESAFTAVLDHALGADPTR